MINLEVGNMSNLTIEELKKQWEQQANELLESLEDNSQECPFDDEDTFDYDILPSSVWEKGRKAWEKRNEVVERR